MGGMQEKCEILIRELHHLAEEESLVPMDLLLLADPSEQAIKSLLPRSQVFVAHLVVQSNDAVHGNKTLPIIGVYVLTPTRPQTVEITNVAVMEEYQGKGIGKQLVLHAIQTAKSYYTSPPVKTIEIGTGNSTIGGLILYQKCGFRIVGVDRDFFLRHYSEEIWENGIQCVDMIRMAMDL